ncbi:reductase [Kosakonia sacchari]|nr:reductase [Kosakonia sacchari]
MKKSCQVYNLLFCKGEPLPDCTISVATIAVCTILSHCFGAFWRRGLFCFFLAQIVG